MKILSATQFTLVEDGRDMQKDLFLLAETRSGQCYVALCEGTSGEVKPVIFSFGQAQSMIAERRRQKRRWREDVPMIIPAFVPADPRTPAPSYEGPDSLIDLVGDSEPHDCGSDCEGHED